MLTWGQHEHDNEMRTIIAITGTFRHNNSFLLSGVRVITLFHCFFTFYNTTKIRYEQLQHTSGLHVGVEQGGMTHLRMLQIRVELTHFNTFGFCLSFYFLLFLLSKVIV